MRRTDQPGHYRLDTPPRTFAGALGWFTLGVAVGIGLVLALGLYLTPARGKAWVDPPEILR